MSEKHVYPAEPQSHSLVDKDAYEAMYQASIKSPDTFWADQAKAFIDFFEPWDTVVSGDFSKADVKWFDGGKLNVCYNCIDRHLPNRADQVALIWEGDEPDTRLSIKRVLPTKAATSKTQ